MKDYKAYLIDLDGTMYRGNEVIEEAPLFIQWLIEQERPYLFLTNNSARTPEQLADKMGKMGITCGPEHFFTSGMATAEYIELMKSGKKVYLIGEEGVRQALMDKGCDLTLEHPDYVVIGIDRDLTYDKLAKASLFVQQGAVFLSTNSDRAIPTEQGLVPGNGAITTAVSVASGATPQYIGKPESLFVELALQKLGKNAEEVLLVGDNLLTDIAAGQKASVDTLLVYTGITRSEDVDQLSVKPTYAVNHLIEWMRQF
jgi:4-nitrophenyl phosphatase